MKKQFRSTLLAGTMLLAALTGCGGSASASTENGTQLSGASVHKIAVVQKTLDNDFWRISAKGVEAAAKDLGVEVNLIGPPNETAYDEQMNEIETVLSSGDAEVVCIAPLQPQTASTMVANANVPIIAFDSNFDSDKIISYVGVSNKDAAAMLAEYVVDQLGTGLKVALLAGTQGDNASGDRMAGYTEVLEANGCTVLETQYTDCATDRAVSCMEGLLQKYPKGEIDAVLTLSDDVAIGASTACQQAGRDDVVIYGFGGYPGGQYVKDGTIKATVDINPYEMGYNVVAKALAAINGETLDSFYPTEPKIIDESNVDEFLAEQS